MTSRRRMSPLAAARAETQPRTMGLPPALVVDPTLPDEEGAVAAYCPVKHRLTGAPMCVHVACGECQMLAQELVERVPNHAWVCTKCLTGLRALPHWKDGVCEGCGKTSCVLMLAVPAEMANG